MLEFSRVFKQAFGQVDALNANFSLVKHSVLEHIQIKGSYPDQILTQHESLYPIGLLSARIKIRQIGNFFTI